MTDIAVGDVVQIEPSHDLTFGGHFLVVTELKSWGVMGYVAMLEERSDPEKAGGLAYYRVAFDNIVRIGRSEWASLRDAHPRPDEKREEGE